MTQPDSAKHAPMNSHRAILIAISMNCMRASLLPPDRTLLALRNRCYTPGGQKQESSGVDRNWLKQYPAGVPADIDPDRYASLRDLFDEACAAHGHAPAFTNMGATLSFTQLDELSRAFAAWLQRKSGLVPGDRVALMMPNILQYPIALFGVLRAGMVVVNTNPLYTPRELEHQLKDSAAKAIVIVENFAHVLQQVLPSTALKHVLTTRIGDLLGFPRGLIVNVVLRYVRKRIPPWSIPGTSTFKSALGSGLGLHLEPVSLGGQDTAFLQYTGGAPGVAKAATLTHRNMVANVLQAHPPGSRPRCGPAKRAWSSPRCRCTTSLRSPAIAWFSSPWARAMC